MSGLKLYWNRFCPFVQRAWIAGLEKGVKFDLEHVPLPTPESFLKINPRGTVPVLDIGNGTLVYESMIIARYLDESVAPANSLNPGDADTKYAVNFFIDEVGSAVGALYGTLSQGPNSAEAREANAVLARLEALLVRQSAGPFFLGTTFSLADIALVPFLERFSVTLKAHHGIELFAKAPRLEALYRAALLRPSVFSTAQPAVEYAKGYTAYVHVKTEVAPTPLPKFYYALACPYAHRAWIALNLKKVAYEPVVLDLANVPESFARDVNPRAMVPALQYPDTKKTVVESGFLVQYAEEQFPGQGETLAYATPLAAARGRFFVDEFDGVPFRKATSATTPEEKKESAANLRAGLERLEALLAAGGAQGPFATGERISPADVLVLPWLIRYDAYAAHFGLPPLAEFPRLHALLRASLALEGVTATVLPAQQYIGFATPAAKPAQ